VADLVSFAACIELEDPDLNLRHEALWLALLLTACASPAPAPSEVAAAGAGQQVCTRETPTGSAIPVTRCRTQAEIDQERRDAEIARDTVRGRASQPGGKGGT